MEIIKKLESHQPIYSLQLIALQSDTVYMFYIKNNIQTLIFYIIQTFYLFIDNSLYNVFGEDSRN